MSRTVFCCVLLVVSSFAVSVKADITARRALSMVLPDLKLENVSLSSAIDFMRDASQANIHVNWRALEAAGVGKDSLINVHLRAVPLRKVLGLALSEAASGNTLTYYVDGNIIEVTTRALADQDMITRVYPVDDLIVQVPDFVGPDFSINQASSVGGGSSGTSVIQGSTTEDKQADTTRADRAQALIDTIQSVVQPEVWNINGGAAAIRFFNGSLIVTAPRSVHEALGSTAD